MRNVTLKGVVTMTVQTMNTYRSGLLSMVEIALPCLTWRGAFGGVFMYLMVLMKLRINSHPSMAAQLLRLFLQGQ